MECAEFTGGAFVFVEQRPRARSRPEAVGADRADVLISTARERPVTGKNGTCRVGVKHGVSRLLTGERCALGIIFHDAR